MGIDAAVMMLCTKSCFLAHLIVYIVMHYWILCYGFSQCNLPPCKKLPLVPPRWRYGNNDVPIIAMNCRIPKDDCSLDINALLENNTDYGNDETRGGGYLTIDLRFICSSNRTKLDFSKTSRANDSVLAAIRIEECDTSWDDVAELGKRYNLLEVEMIYASQPKLSRVLGILSDGLKQIHQIRFTFANFSGKVNVEKLLPTISPMENIAQFSVQCQSDTTSVTYCKKDIVNYNADQLPELFPNLQMINLAGVYPSKVDTRLSFPWTDGYQTLSLNLSYSTYERNRMKYDKLKSQEIYQYERALTVVSNVDIINLKYVCPFQREVHAIVFIENGAQEIPSDCFNPSPTTSSTLQYLDLSRNDLRNLPNNIFTNLTDLKALHIPRNGLEEIQPNLFDDLINLRVLNLDYNKIKIVRKGLFVNLISLETLFLHGNPLHTIEYRSFPTYSFNLTFVDLRWNHLESLPYDCLTLPNLERCDCDHNKISFENENSLENLMSVFNPVRMYQVQPLPYYGAARRSSDNGPMNENDQHQISLRDNKIQEIKFNNSWPMDKQRQLSAFLSYYQINLEAKDSHSALECDCSLFYLKHFILSNHADALLNGSLFYHSLVVSRTNFQSWKCSVHPVLRPNAPLLPFIDTPDSQFVCVNRSLEGCPRECTCLSRADGQGLLIDCTGRTLKSFPSAMLVPESGSSMVVSLEKNAIDKLRHCDEQGFGWLRHVTTLNLRHNEITPKNQDELENFLNCLEKVTHLDLSLNNIRYLPIGITRKNYTELSISGNKLICDCNTKWMKSWLQEKNDSIPLALIVHCSNNKLHPIVELNLDTDFPCEGIQQYIAAITGSICFAVVLISLGLTFYFYEFEIKILLFEKLNLHPFDKQDCIEEKQYDLFLIYDRKDEVWVINTLLKGLERLGYRTCVTDRDFAIGASTAAEMAETFTKSHRVVVVISQSFVDSDYAMSDFFHAYEHDRIPTGKRFLVLVKKDKNINFGERHIFKKYISTNFFVPIEAKRFWARLCYWLPKPQNIPAATDNIELEREEEQRDLVRVDTVDDHAGFTNDNDPLII